MHKKVYLPFHCGAHTLNLVMRPPNHIILLACQNFTLKSPHKPATDCFLVIYKQHRSLSTHKVLTSRDIAKYSRFWYINERAREHEIRPLIMSTPLFSEEQLAHINKQLNNATPQQIIQWAITTIPNLYQTTAFGLSGLVTLDIISKLYPEDSPVQMIFYDTLHHFPETLKLIDDIKARYPSVKLNIYKPEGVSSEQEFAKVYGEKLWESNDLYYDYLVKVEPAQRSYKEMDVRAVFTGRRRSQGAARSELPIVEIVEDNLIKINPLANWSFDDVHTYIKANNVPYNTLLDKGYRSVGDYHSTVPVKEGEDERAGRWKGQNKTECGIHDTAKFSALKVMSA